MRFTNAVRCIHCNTTIESTHVHDFVTCQCALPTYQVSVDGGAEYRKRSFGDRAAWTEVYEEYDDGNVPLEHTDPPFYLIHTHHPSKCKGRPCTLHNRTDHSKRPWVQGWHNGQMVRISPWTGRRYKDPDSPR